MKLTALELAGLLHGRKMKISEALDIVFKHADEKEKELNCFITLCREEAFENAAAIQARLDRGEISSRLAGVPVSVKDNICAKGIRTTCGSKTLENFVPFYNAHVINLMNSADMILTGKTNMDEFAMGSTSETSFFGETSNPWNTAHVPGGSSGGSAAAVAAGEAFAALGSDTGGSIRQPSSFCGVTGLKPTYGSVSRRGAVAFASSLDQIGTIGLTAADCAAFYEIICGRDELDSTYAGPENFNFDRVLSYNIKGKRIGLPKQFFAEGLQNDIAESVRLAAAELEKNGAVIEEFDLPIAEYAIPAYYIISCAEASSNLSRYDGIEYGYLSPGADDLGSAYIKSRSEGFGMEVKRRMMLGSFVLSSGYYDAYYNKALQAKRLIQNSFNEAFKKFDIILGPVAPSTAPKKGESLSDPLKMYLGDIYTVIVNLAGLPAISVPCGLDKSGLPIGMQFIGKAFDEEQILGAAHFFQQITNFHRLEKGA